MGTRLHNSSDDLAEEISRDRGIKMLRLALEAPQDFSRVGETITISINKLEAALKSNRDLANHHCIISPQYTPVFYAVRFFYNKSDTTQTRQIRLAIIKLLLANGADYVAENHYSGVAMSTLELFNLLQKELKNQQESKYEEYRGPAYAQAEDAYWKELAEILSYVKETKPGSISIKDLDEISEDCRSKNAVFPREETQGIEQEDTQTNVIRPALFVVGTISLVVGVLAVTNVIGISVILSLLLLNLGAAIITPIVASKIASLLLFSSLGHDSKSDETPDFDQQGAWLCS